MLSQLFKIVFRHIHRQKAHSFINIAGLADCMSFIIYYNAALADELCLPDRDRLADLRGIRAYRACHCMPHGWCENSIRRLRKSGGESEV